MTDQRAKLQEEGMSAKSKLHSHKASTRNPVINFHKLPQNFKPQLLRSCVAELIEYWIV